jgi:peptidyl-prolyl cis-trans isomerase D
MVMQLMRRKMKVIMWVVIVTFVVGFVYVIMGTGGNAGRRQGKLARGIVGEVGGQEISYRQYQDALSRSRDLYRNRYGTDPDETTFRQLEQEAWQGLITNMMLQQAYRRYGVRIYDEELVGIIRNRPPEELQRDPQMFTDGRFDMQKYQAVISNPQNIAWLNQYEQQLREQLPQQKLNLQILAGVRVTDNEIVQAFQERNEKVRASFIAVDPGRFMDARQEVPAQAVQDYYQKHQDEFKAPERAKILFVALSKDPTERDLATVKQRIDEIHAQAVTRGVSFDTLAMETSEDPGSAQNGGDLGWFEKQQMDPAFGEAAFRLSPGQVSRPVQSGYGWHIIKCEGRKTENGKQLVHARHILLRNRASDETLAELRSKAELFLEQAKQKGFKAAAADNGLQATPSGFMSRGSFVPGLGVFPEAVNFAFEEGKGEISQVMENEGALVVAQVLEKRKEGVQPLADVEQRIKMTIMREQAKQQAVQLALQIRGAAESGQDLARAAAAAGLKLDTTGLVTRNDMVPGVGSRNQFTAAIFSLPVGELGGPVATDYGVYLIRVEQHLMPDQAQLGREAPAIAQQMLQYKQQMAMQQWYNTMQSSVKVRDYRSAGM